MMHWCFICTNKCHSNYLRSGYMDWIGCRNWTHVQLWSEPFRFSLSAQKSRTDPTRPDTTRGRLWLLSETPVVGTTAWTP